MKNMNLAEIWPKFNYLHLLQERIDRHNVTTEKFITDLRQININIPTEIQNRGIDTTLNYIGEFGWANISTWISQLYK